MMYIGIDIGKTGAMGFLDDKGQFVSVEDLPVRDAQYTKTGKKFYKLSVHAFCTLLAMQYSRHICIEVVWARPGEGVSSGFGHGRLLGAIEGIVALHEANHSYVLPQTWKRHFKLIGKEKGDSLALARELFPTATLTRKRDHNRAEALLIARYAWEMDYAK